MTKLQVNVAHFPEQVNEPGEYTIKQYRQPKELKYGVTITLITTNSKGEERSLFVTYKPETSDNTNLGRLVKCFGDDPEHWIGKKIEITFDQDKRHIQPVVE